VHTPARSWASEAAGTGGWLVILGAIALAASAGPAAHAIRDLIMMAAITMAVVLGVAATVAVLTYRLRHRSPRALTQPGTRALSAPRRRRLTRAAEVHLHVHGVCAEDVAAIIARQHEPGE
jgi:hypothetical protein